MSAPIGERRTQSRGSEGRVEGWEASGVCMQWKRGVCRQASAGACVASVHTRGGDGTHIIAAKNGGGSMGARQRRRWRRRVSQRQLVPAYSGGRSVHAQHHCKRIWGGRAGQVKRGVHTSLVRAGSGALLLPGRALCCALSCPFKARTDSRRQAARAVSSGEEAGANPTSLPACCGKPAEKTKNFSPRLRPSCGRRARRFRWYR